MMDQLDDICTKGMESLSNADQAQLDLTDYRAAAPSNVLLEEQIDDGLPPGIAVEEVLLQNSRQAATTFSWLMQNYESSEGYSLPRCLIYDHYMDFCQRNVLQPVNAASFGKTIRQVFPEIRTRRLGTRGQSKYHYYGIKVRSDSPYYSTLVASQRMSLPCPASGQWLAKTFSSVTPSPTHSNTPSTSMTSSNGGHRSQKSVRKDGSLRDEEGDGVGVKNGAGSDGGSASGSMGKSVSSIAGLQKGTGVKTPVKGFTHEPALPITPLIQPVSSSLLPPFPTPSELVHLPPNIDHHQVDELLKDYRVHCAIILEVIMRGGLDEVDYYFQTFWTNLPVEQKRLLEIPSICDALVICDTYLYHTIVSVLIPGTLNSVPQSLLQGIRQFSYEIPRTMESALKSLPNKLMQSKTPAVKRFSRLLKRKTSLAHLAQASRSALAVDITITQMRLDWERRTEHDTVCSQLMWTMPLMKGLRQEDIRAHMDSFKKLLESRASVEDHVKWVEEVRSFFVEKGYPRGSLQYEKAERAFFMGWSYICSLIIRDQTLRSATSFGSFHLLNLLYEEYLLYVIELHRYQREEVALWNNVMDPNTQMTDGFLLNDIDLDLDDCDDLFDMSTSSMMSMGAGNDLFDDDIILSASSAVNVAPPPTVPTRPVKRKAESMPVVSNQLPKYSKPILLPQKTDLISMAFSSSSAGSPDDGNQESHVDMSTDISTWAEHGPSLVQAKPSSESVRAGQSGNATPEKQKDTSSKDNPAFVTTKVIRATLLPESDQKPSSSASSKMEKCQIAKVPQETPAAPSILTLNVPMLPGLDLHKGQFLTAGDGNKYIINEVETVLQPVKETI